jgi:peptidoglycan/LPS O-acetylase OafA/YrhL
MDKKISFLGLNEIRAAAALLVFFHHAEVFKCREGVSSLFDFSLTKHFIDNIGQFSVVCFFVLSGFLITYLLISEKEKKGTIRISDFYMRRVLRIWPLYFLTIGIGFLIIPLLSKAFVFDDQEWYPNLVAKLDYSTLPIFLFMLSNFGLLCFRPIAGAAHTWSVSLEEQFYLIWPLILKVLPLGKQFILVILFMLGLKEGLGHFAAHFLDKDSFFITFMRAFSVQYMFIGALLASILYWDMIPSRVKRILAHRLFVLFWVVVVVVACARLNSGLILACFFAVLILSFILNGVRIKMLNRLGNISYGIYMIHPLCLFISFELASIALFKPHFQVVFYLLSISSTLLLSELSYRYFESPFLKFKHKFTVIESGQ